MNVSRPLNLGHDNHASNEINTNKSHGVLGENPHIKDGHTPITQSSEEAIEAEPAKTVPRVPWNEAVTQWNVAGMSRIESYMTYFKDYGAFGDWCKVYPFLLERQKQGAKREVWILDRAQGRFRLVTSDDDEKCPTRVSIVEGGDDSEFWYFWDYDTGTKKRMNGIAARQIEAGYQLIKKMNYDVDPVLRTGVAATEGIYDTLNATYKLSYSVQPAAQKDKQHICVYQINVRTGFQRLLERFPPETTPAKLRPGSFMEVFFMSRREMNSAVTLDFWVKSGKTHFQQTWDATVIRFVIDAPLSDNRKSYEAEVMRLWKEKKLVGVGPFANVELKPEARNVKPFMLSLGHERLSVRRDALSCKLAIMNYMHGIRESGRGTVSNEMALSSTKEYFGNHFFTVFSNESQFRREFLQQYNETPVVSYDHVPFDLEDMVVRVKKLLGRRDLVGPEWEDFCLNYSFDPQKQKKNSMTFAAVHCDPALFSQDRDTLFPNQMFIDTVEEMDKALNRRVRRQRNALASRHASPHDASEVLVEDVVFDTSIKMTRDIENYVMITAFPFDPDHVYLFRGGAVVRLDEGNYLKVLMKIAHLLPNKCVNDFKILSVETYPDGGVQYGCQKVDDDSESLTLVRKRYHQLMNMDAVGGVTGFDADEKELESAHEFGRAPLRLDGRSEADSLVDAVQNLLNAVESLEQQVSACGEILSSFYPLEIKRRTEGHLLCEFLSYAVDESNEAFPTLAVFKDFDGFSARSEIRLLCSTNEFGDIEMRDVMSASIHCWNNRSVLGLVVDRCRTHLFEIDVGGTFDRVGQVAERLNQLELSPRAVLVKSNGRLCLSSPFVDGASDDDGLVFDCRESGTAERLTVKFGECGVLEDFLEEENLAKIDQTIAELHEWSIARKRVGRQGRFAVYFAKSSSFEYLNSRLKRTRNGQINEEHDEYMERLDRFVIEKWKQYTNSQNRVHPQTVYVLIIDHDVYTMRKIVHAADEPGLKTKIEREYKIDEKNAANSFVYEDDSGMNAREECTARGFYVSLRMETMPGFECHICYETKNTLSTLSCGHSACHQCIRQQLLRDNNSCALCRHDIMHPYMIPRPNQNAKNVVHKYYGSMFHRTLRYKAFADDVEWTAIQALQSGDRGGVVPA